MNRCSSSAEWNAAAATTTGTPLLPFRRRRRRHHASGTFVSLLPAVSWTVCRSGQSGDDSSSSPSAAAAEPCHHLRFSSPPVQVQLSDR